MHKMLLSAGPFLAIIAACTIGIDDSETKIVGGQATTDYSEVQMMLTDKAGLEICTGVVVSDSTMLLAGHCIKDGTLHLGIRASGTQIDTVGVYLWNRLINRKFLTPEEAARDLAIAVFPKGTFKGPYASVALESPMVNQGVDLVGFGATQFGQPVEINSDATLGKKNFGSNRIVSVKDGLITLESKLDAQGLPVEGAVAASGDSGSPLFLSGSREIIGICSAVGALDTQGQLVPLDSAGDIDLKKASTIRNLYVDITSSTSRRLMELAVYHGAHIPGIKNPGMSTIPDEDTPWMRRDQPGFFGKSSYRAIFFQLVIGRGNVTQTTPQQPTQLTGSLFNIRKGNIIQFGGLTPTVSTGNTRPPTSVSNQPIGRPPAVIRPQQSGIVTSRPATVARPAVPATVARPAVPATVARPAVPATTPPKPAPAPAPSSANIQTVPAATAVQASVDKTNANTGQPDSLESQAQAFWQGVDDSKKQQISYDASQTEKQRAMYNQGNESQDKLTMEQNAEAFFEGVKDQQKGSASWDASRTDSQNEMYNLGWDNAKSGTCDMSKAAENNGWGYNHSTKASCK